MSKPFEEALAHANRMLRPKQHPTEIDITYISPLQTIHRRTSGRVYDLSPEQLHRYSQLILNRQADPQFHEPGEKDWLEGLLGLPVEATAAILGSFIPGLQIDTSPSKRTAHEIYMDYTQDPEEEAQRKWDIQEKSRAMAPHFESGPFSEFKTDDAGTSTLDGITIDTEAAFKHGGGLSDLDKTININGQPHRLAWVNPPEERALKRMGGSGKEVRGRPAYYYGSYGADVSGLPDEGIGMSAAEIAQGVEAGYTGGDDALTDIIFGDADTYPDEVVPTVGMGESYAEDRPETAYEARQMEGRDYGYGEGSWDFGLAEMYKQNIVNPDTGLSVAQTEDLSGMRETPDYKNFKAKLGEHFDAARRGSRVHTLQNIDLLQQQATDVLYKWATSDKIADRDKYESYIDTLEGKDQLLGGKLGVNNASKLLFDDVLNDYMQSEIRSGIKSATDEKQLEADIKLARDEGVKLSEIQGRKDRDKVELTREQVTDVVRNNNVAPLTVVSNVHENTAIPFSIGSAFLTPLMPSSIATMESGRRFHVSKDGHVTFVSPEDPLDYAGQDDFGNIDESLKRYRKPVEVASVSETVEEEDSPLTKFLKEREEPKTRDQLDAAMRERVKPLYAGRNIFAT